MRRISRVLIVLALGLAGLSAGLARAGTSVQPYAVAVDGAYDVRPLLSVGDTVPETSHPSMQYQMVGIPDGLAIARNPDGTIALYMNHEFTNSVTSQPIAGEPMYKGAFVSNWTLDTAGNVLSGERAYDAVYRENVLVGPAAEEGNDTPAFARFCSASIAGREAGFDRTIYFTNEESDGAATFDGRGGQTVAIFDNELHTLPKLGRFAKENTVVMPSSGKQTVIISLEDGPSGPDSQLYMYVGTKERAPGASALRRNGLDNGSLYVFVSDVQGKTNEASFQEGTINGHWQLIPGADEMTDTELEIASDALGAFGFVRIEDGAFSKSRAHEFFFVTTGGSADAGNELGRLYQLSLDPYHVTGHARLQLVYNADAIVDAGGDIALSPDNLDVSRSYMMINEDGTTPSRAIMTQHNRDGAIWRFDLGAGVDVSSAEMVVELNPPGRDGTAVGAGVWETSGIIDASAFFGRDAWIFDVQAHSPTATPGTGTVEDGQLLLMKPFGWPHTR
jgi:hypothetical protein